MSGKLQPSTYRRIAGEFRALANSVKEPEKSAEARKMAEDYERKAESAEAEPMAQIDQIEKPN